MPSLSFQPRQSMFTSFSTVSPATGRSSSLSYSQSAGVVKEAAPSLPPPARRATAPILTHPLDDDSDLLNDYPDPVKRNDSLLAGVAATNTNMNTETSPITPESSSVTAAPNSTVAAAADEVDARPDLSILGPHKDEILMIPVRVAEAPRQDTIGTDEALPDRPRKRSFLRRVSTHFKGNAEREPRYRAVRMPRREYVKYFVRDPTTGAYAGTEPEREWTDAEIDEHFGQWKDVPVTRPVNNARINVAAGIPTMIPLVN